MAPENHVWIYFIIFNETGVKKHLKLKNTNIKKIRYIITRNYSALNIKNQLVKQFDKFMWLCIKSLLQIQIMRYIFLYIPIPLARNHKRTFLKSGKF